MKKLLSIALAVVMMMAVCVPAFAGEIKYVDGTATPEYDAGTTTHSSTADVVTTYDETNPPYTYSVTFPATTTVTWNDTNTPYDVAYSVTSQLLLGASLNVSVNYDADADTTNDGNMTLTATDGTVHTIKYTLSGAGTATFGEVNNAAKASEVGGTDATLKVTDFSNVPVGKYEGTITYMVEYVAPTTA